MKINHKLSHKPLLHNGTTNSNGNYQQKNIDRNNLSDFLKLPIYKYQAEIAKQIQQSNRVILIGETGCGKTTQVPKIIYNTLGGETYSSKIVITQPRRVAAISVSLRVSQEMQTKIGGLVGYSVRFDERSSDKTKIKYVTDGMLLREAILDNTLSNYNVVIIDEIHERSINTDTLLALILRIQKKRKDLKLVVMSATIDVDKLKSYLNTECVVSVSGRSFPIEVYHLLKPEKNYIDAACNTIMQIILMEEEEEYKTGDILVFLPGQEDIEDLTELLSTKNQLIINNNTGLPILNSINNDNIYNDSSNKKRIKQLAIYQLFSNLPNSEQMKVFKPINNNTHTKIILATNIAETSLTIKNIKYVIDCGYFKTRVYDASKDLDNLIQTRIYKNSAIQRSGRAGRESAGKCFRIYTHEEYSSMLDNPIPEILRTNLKSLIILIKSIGVNNLSELEYLDAPEKDAYKKSLDELVSLKAIDFEGALTELGKQLSILPVDTNLGKILINTFMFDEFRFIQDEILSIVALLQTDNIFYTPSGLKDKAEMVRSKFTNNTSDHITLLNVFYQWKEYLKENKLGNNDDDIINNDTNFNNDNNYGNNNSSLSEKWCKEFFVNEKSLRKAEEIKKQLRRYLIRIVENADSIIQENELENEIMKKKSVLFVDKVKLKERKEELIIKCLLTGYVGNIAKYTSDNVFVTVKCKHQCRVHPSSVVNKNIQLAKQSGYIVFSEIVTTSKQYLKICSIVDKSMVDKIQV